MAHEHNHDEHDHDGHEHGSGHEDSHAAPDPLVVRTQALEALLMEKGLIDPAAIDALIDQYEHHIGPRIGARVVVRAWTDLDFRELLLRDANTALAQAGVGRLQGEDMIVLENTPTVHNVVVCTLCSCYPWPVLGLPPPWYKAMPYRSRIVREPRVVLREFGLEVSDDIEVRVWDSNAELRYMVLPMRPAESHGLGAEDLAHWVTRDSMIGVGVARAPIGAES